MDNTLAVAGTRAQHLYQIAATCPIYDFHCHLDPQRLQNDQPWTDLSALWVQADPYKWRAMRMAGVDEQLVSGAADPWDRFQAWAATLPLLAGNPLLVWSQMELQRFFGIDERLTPASAADIWQACNAQLQEERFQPRRLLLDSGFAALCTSDDWLADLSAHASCQAPRVQPSLRADALLAVHRPDYGTWLGRLGTTSHTTITDWDSLLAAIRYHVDRFHAAGCRLADHSLESLFWTTPDTAQADRAVRAICAGDPLSISEQAQLRSSLLLALATEYRRRNWSLQLHLGAQRATSSRLAQACPGAGGYACMGGGLHLDALITMLDCFESAEALPRCILFPLNPRDMEMLACLCGSFVQAGSPGHVQLGPAWWYNDHRSGMLRQLRAAAEHGVLGLSVGMTTDSRSFLSGIRHDYFRRLLCSQLAAWIEAGELPDDPDYHQELIEAICWRNAAAMMTVD